jgi:hypothetical protein
MSERLFIEAPLTITIHAVYDVPRGYWSTTIKSTYSSLPKAPVVDRFELLTSDELADVLEVGIRGRLGCL